MKILVTGAFGNIGSHVVTELLQRGYDIACFDLKTSARTKVECEDIILKSGLEAVIIRLAAAPVSKMGKMNPMIFQIRLDTRMEFVHPADVARAIANSITCKEVWGKIYLVGGGKECQLLYKDFIGGILNTVGIDALPDAAFGTTPFYTEWLDTAESQRLLQY